MKQNGKIQADIPQPAAGPAPAQPLIDSAEAFAARFGVSRETIARLNLYESLLKRWQPTINLVAPATLPHIWRRHFADSAQLMALIPSEARSLADLGSGGGFPGLVLAIMLAERPGFKVALIESDRRKAAFLQEVARQTGVHVEILSTRAENQQTEARLGRIDVVTARALAPLDRLLDLAAPLFGPQTVGLLLKGRQAESEVQAARKRWDFDVVLVESVTDLSGRVCIVRNLSGRRQGQNNQ